MAVNSVEELLQGLSVEIDHDDRKIIVPDSSTENRVQMRLTVSAFSDYRVVRRNAAQSTV